MEIRYMMQQTILQIDGQSIPLYIIPSKQRRRTIAMKITDDAIAVRTPWRCDAKLIQEFIDAKKSRIGKHWQKKQEKVARTLRFEQ